MTIDALTAGDITGTAAAGAVSFTATGAGKDATIKSSDAQVVLDANTGVTIKSSTSGGVTIDALNCW